MEIETITIETTDIKHIIYIELWVNIEVNESFIVCCHNITTRIPLKESYDHHNLCNITQPPLNSKHPTWEYKAIKASYDCFQLWP